MTPTITWHTDKVDKDKMAKVDKDKFDEVDKMHSSFWRRP